MAHDSGSSAGTLTVDDAPMPAATSAPRAPAATPEASPHPADAEYPVSVIAASGRWPRVDFRELWQFRQLFAFFVWRDLKVRYAQTVLGLGWAILQPVLTTVIFTIIFGRFAKVPSNGYPYAVFALVGLVPWTYFSNAFGQSALSLLNQAHMLKKVYFPRLAIPATPILVAGVDYGIGILLALVVMAFYGMVPDAAALVTIPLATLTIVATALGIGSWLSALNVQYRDVKHIVPFATQIWMYASPIVYPISLIPEQLRPLYAINPLAGAIEGFRAGLLPGGETPWGLMAISFASSLVILAGGVLYFRHTERHFADVA